MDGTCDFCGDEEVEVVTATWDGRVACWSCIHEMRLSYDERSRL